MKQDDVVPDPEPPVVKVICEFCEKEGHVVDDCPQLHDMEGGNAKQMATLFKSGGQNT